MADEVCFQARVHPAAACNTLSSEQVGDGMKGVAPKQECCSGCGVLSSSPTEGRKK